MHPALPLLQRHILSMFPVVLQNTAPTNYNVKGFQNTVWIMIIKFNIPYGQETVVQTSQRKILKAEHSHNKS